MCFEYQRIKFQWKHGSTFSQFLTVRAEEADPLQRQVQTADAHEGAHQGEAVPLRGEWQTASTLVSRNIAPLNHHYMTPARSLTRGGVILRSCVTRDSG